MREFLGFFVSTVVAFMLIGLVGFASLFFESYVNDSKHIYIIGAIGIFLQLVIIVALVFVVRTVYKVFTTKFHTKEDVHAIQTETSDEQISKPHPRSKNLIVKFIFAFSLAVLLPTLCAIVFEVLDS